MTEGIDSPPEVREVFGEMCSTASDPVACADAVAAAESGDSLVSTAGDGRAVAGGRAGDRVPRGALLGAWQAKTSPDPVVASAMGPIADDETRHAELSFAIAAWAEPRLQPAERAQVDAARWRAIRALREEAGRTPIGVEADLGLPAGPIATRLLDGLERQVWPAAM